MLKHRLRQAKKICLVHHTFMPITASLAEDTLGLLPLDELAKLDYHSREILLGRLMQQRKMRRARSVNRALALPDPADWIESSCFDSSKVSNPEQPQGAPRPRLGDFQKRILRHCFTINPATGRFPYRTVVYSAPKKSGKSSIGAWVTAWYAANVEAPNAVYVLANDREQSAGRVFGFARPTLFGLGGRRDGKYKIVLPNGSYALASTSEPEKEAGASYGLTVWDELWAYKSERARLLWDELRPIGTRTNSMRLVVTYAGFEDSSDLLLMLYLKVFQDTSERALAPGARPVPGLEDIQTTDSLGNAIPCCYEVPEIGLFYFNDHEQRMSWQQGEHGEALLRETVALESAENTYRLTHNRWQVTENRFVDEGVARAAYGRAEAHVTRPMTFGVDAGWRRDCAALVGMYDRDGRYVTGFSKVWKPERDGDAGGLDLEATILEEILKLWRAGLIARRAPAPGEKQLVEQEHLRPIDVWYDETQMHQVAMNLRKKYRLLLARFNQGRERLLSDTFLQNAYLDFRVDNPADAELQSHLEAAKAESQNDANQNLIRIVKSSGTHAKPIDAIVAQSMAIYRRSARAAKPMISAVAQGKAKGWQKR